MNDKPPASLASKTESPLKRYFRIRPVVVQDEPHAQRIEFHVGNQTFSVGPEYCEDVEQAEWFVNMLIYAMHEAFSGLCNQCHGRGWVEAGDPESGSVPETCAACGGKGRLSPVTPQSPDETFGSWRPIETAPKDGTVILVPGGIGYWRERLNHWETEGWHTLTGFDYPGKPIQWKLDHWMPMPTIPAQYAQKATGEST